MIIKLKILHVKKCWFMSLKTLFILFVQTQSMDFSSYLFSFVLFFLRFLRDFLILVIRGFLRNHHMPSLNKSLEISMINEIIHVCSIFPLKLYMVQFSTLMRSGDSSSSKI